LILSIHNSDGR